jgi:hypothetical protein
VDAPVVAAFAATRVFVAGSDIIVLVLAVRIVRVALNVFCVVDAVVVVAIAAPFAIAIVVTEVIGAVATASREESHGKKTSHPNVHELPLSMLNEADDA